VPVSYFVDPSGSVVELPSEQAKAAAEAGYTPASPEQAAEFARKDALAKEFGTGPQALMAGAEAFGRAATFGLSTGVQRALGADPARIAAREEVNPTEAAIGTIGGVGVPLLLTGGASAAAGGARGALAGIAELSGPALAAKAGQAVTGAAARALPAGASAASQIASRAIAAGAGQAVEGALYGVGEVVNEAALGDPKLSAESALATLGLSAVLGGGVGAGLGVVEAAVPIAAKKARDTIARAFTKGEDVLKDVYRAAENVTGTPGDVATLLLENKIEVQNLAREVPGIVDEISNATPEMAKFILDRKGRFAELEKAFPGTTRQLARTSPETASYLLDNWEKIITDPTARNKIASSLSDSMQTVLDTTEDLLRKANAEILPAERETMLKEIRFLADRKKVEAARAEVLGRVENAAARMRSEPDLYDQSYARQLEVLREGIERDLGATPGKGWADPVEVFERFRTLRRSIGDLTPFEKEGIALSLAERNAAGVLKSLYGEVKQKLVDESIFGAAAAKQALYDDLQSEWINATKRFRKQFGEKVMESGGPVYKIKPTKLTTWLNQMADSKGGPQGDLRGVASSEIWGRTLDAAKRILNEVDQSAQRVNLPIDRESLQTLLERASDVTRDAQQRAAVTLMKTTLDPRRMPWGSHAVVDPALPLAAQAAQAVAPQAVTGLVSGTLRIAKEATSVPRAVSVLASLERAGRATAQKIEEGAKALFDKTRKPARAVRSAAIATTVDAATRDDLRPERLYMKRAQRLNILVQQPEAMIDALVQATRDIEDGAPSTATALQVATVRGVSFLAAKAPQPPDLPALSPLRKAWRPSSTQLATFGRYVEAVDDPIGATLGNALAGTLTPEGVEAVREVYPELFSAIQNTVIEALAGTDGDVPAKSRLMVSMLLGSDVSGGLESFAANQAALRGPSKAPSQQVPNAAPSRADRLSVAERSATDAQRRDGV
jgi:hypothetical protein